MACTTTGHSSSAEGVKLVLFHADLLHRSANAMLSWHESITALSTQGHPTEQASHLTHYIKLTCTKINILDLASGKHNQSGRGCHPAVASLLEKSLTRSSLSHHFPSQRALHPSPHPPACFGPLRFSYS